MKIRVTRTSNWSFDPNHKPCEEAFLFDLPRYKWHFRTCKSFEEFDKKFASTEGAWLSKGFDHGCNKDGIYRKEGQGGQAWYIQLSSLEELQRFAHKYGECIIYEVDDELCIEIYDGYRE